MRFTASAPCKAILFGEHYVVYGASALAIAIEPSNRITFEEWDGSGIALKSSLGNGVLSADGAYDGVPELGIFAAVAYAVFQDARLPSCTAEFEPAWKLKGVGTSASLCAAFAAGLYRLKGEEAGAEKIFSAAQAGDLIAHGGRASGIDAKTVSYGCPLVFKRSFSPMKFDSAASAFKLPAGCSFLLIDTNRGKKEGTGKMLETFAREFGITGTPAEASEEKRQKVRDEYSPLWERVSKEIGHVSASELGALMNENHTLLKNRRMSSPGIEKTISSALSEGAYGAKLTGGGGEGGAVLVLCEKKKQAKIASSIKFTTSFECHSLSLAKKGAGTE